MMDSKASIFRACGCNISSCINAARSKTFLGLVLLLTGLLLSFKPFAQGTATTPDPAAQSTPSSASCQQLSEEGQPACGEEAGNPINVTTGNKFQREVDMPALPGVLGLELVRNYNSAASKLSDAPSMFGRGWRLSYDWALRFDHANKNETIILVRGDGTQIGLYKNPPAKNPSIPYPTWRPSGAEHGMLAQHRKSLDSEYLWTESSGKRYRFNAKGWLISIEAPTGEFLSIERERKGDITKVTDPQGRSLVMSLLSDEVALRSKRFGGVQAVDTPVGRYVYRYGGSLPQGSAVHPNHILSRLTSVEHAGIKREYLFEDVQQVTLLTGIRVEGAGSDRVTMNQRIATWAYDKQGRAIMSMRGDQERVTLLFLPRLKTPQGYETGSTLLTNSLGANTLYRYKMLVGKPHLTEVIGPGCASCGPTNLRHEYDPHGRVIQTTYLAPSTSLKTSSLASLSAKTVAESEDMSSILTHGLKAGRALRAMRYSYDSLGRPSHQLSISYRDGIAEPAQSVLRYEYATSNTFDPIKAFKPKLIARPSVVPGKEHRFEMKYNEYGQITQLSETGFDPVDASEISRVKRFDYDLIQGRSVLTKSDGPLANGPTQSPLDSDITTYKWDSKADRIVAVTAPLGFVRSQVFDAVGRITKSTIDDGARSLTHELHYSTDGRHAMSLEKASLSGAWSKHTGSLASNGESAHMLTLNLERHKYDALGRLTQTIDAAGRVIALGYDDVNRPRSLSDSQGNRSVTDFDSEGRPIKAGLYRPEANDPLRAAYFWHDDHGRPTKRLLADGRIDTWRYGSDGRVSEHINGEDVRTALLKAQGMSSEILFQQATDGDLRIQWRSHGSGVWSGSGGSGATGGSVGPIGPSGFSGLRSSDADGKKLVDDFGRVVKSKLADHGDKLASYDAANHLIKLRHADSSSVHYRYDVGGRLIQKFYENASGVKQGETNLSYEGSLLKAAVDPEQSTRFEYDSLGRKTGENVQIKGLSQTFKTTRIFDPVSGLVIERGLVNGQKMQVSRDSAGLGANVTGVTLRSQEVAWVLAKAKKLLSTQHYESLVRYLPSDTLADNIRIDPFDGLKSFKLGNGLGTERSFDIAGRLTAQVVDKLGTTSYEYSVGPRIRAIEKRPSTDSSPLLIQTATSDRVAYNYSGFGAMLATKVPSDGLVKVALSVGNSPSTAIPATNVPSLMLSRGDKVKESSKDSLGRVINDDLHQYTYTPRGQISEIRERQSKRLIASYRYDSQGHRIAKTVYPGNTDDSAKEYAKTSYFIWQDNSLVAEINEVGKVTAQYFYLNLGEPGQSHRITPIAKWESHANPQNPTKKDRLLFIHVDHRGAPVAMTDGAQDIVWAIDERENQWGAAKPTMRLVSKPNASTQSDRDQQFAPSKSQLNLRLPGQYFDEETGLNDNFNRTYNPRTGHYLQPDPLGYPDGPDAYLYASGDPVNRVDPLGLYEIDTHYYMTYFLGVMAGLSAKQALTMARAAQYIDDNPNTWPVNPKNYSGNYNNSAALKRLSLYHFTQEGRDRPATAAQTIVVPSGSPLGVVYSEDYMRNRVLNPENDQIKELLNAANWLLPTEPNQELTQTGCARTQLFGEYLHALQDTFGHRNQFNVPIGLNGGLGHGLYGVEPDKTYNDNDWRFREDRTIKMERQVFDKIQSQFGTSATPKIGVSIVFEDIETVLRAVNATRENEETAGNLFLNSKKLQLMNNALKSYGYDAIPDYDVRRACENRKVNLAGVGAYFQGQFGKSVILDTPKVCVDRRVER